MPRDRHQARTWYLHSWQCCRWLPAVPNPSALLVLARLPSHSSALHFDPQQRHPSTRTHEQEPPPGMYLVPTQVPGLHVALGCGQP